MLSIINNRMPKEAVPFFWTKCFSTIGYANLYSTLILFLENGLGKSPAIAASITGVFITFNYFLHLLGGFLGGNFISYRNLFLVGMLLELTGSICMLFSNINIYIGLSIFLAGCGIYVSSLNCILTGMFRKEETTLRESAFFWVYAGVNFGFFIGVTLGGYFHMSGNYHHLFITSIITNMIGMLIFLFHWRNMTDKNTTFSNKGRNKQFIHSIYATILIVSIIPMLLFMFKNPNLSTNLVLIIGGVMLCFALLIALNRKDKKECLSMLSFIVLAISVIAFWALFYLAPIGMTLFIKYHVQESINGLQIPPQWYRNVNTVTIVLGAPILATLFAKMRNKGFNISIPMQFTTAIMLMASSFLILPIGIMLSKGKVGSEWIVICYSLQAIGEICISHVGYAMVGQLIHVKWQGVMMGMWMMTGGVASSISRLLSISMVGDAQSNTPPIEHFAQSFNNLGMGMIVMGILLMLLTPKLNRWIGTPSARKEAELQEA